MCVGAPLVAAGFGHYIHLRTSGVSDCNVHNVLHGLSSFSHHSGHNAQAARGNRLTNTPPRVWRIQTPLRTLRTRREFFFTIAVWQRISLLCRLTKDLFIITVWQRISLLLPSDRISLFVSSDSDVWPPILAIIADQSRSKEERRRRSERERQQRTNHGIKQANTTRRARPQNPSRVPIGTPYTHHRL